MLRRRTIGTATLAALALVALGACGSSDKKSEPAAPKARPQVTIDAKDFAFTLPAEMPSGWVDVTVTNTGEQDHQIAFVKLGSLTFDNFKTEAAATNLKGFPADAVFAGGPNNAGPGESVTATVHLDAGKYGVACFIPDSKDGKSHASKGMVGEVDVAPTAESVEVAPTADGGKLDMSEFTFAPDAAFKGQGTVSLTNVGVQVHETIIVKINDGKTLADVKGFFLTPPGTPPPSGPPPFTAAGGVVGVGPNQTVYQKMSLAPGKYVLLCFFPDPTKNDEPHAVEGMIKEITIS